MEPLEELEFLRDRVMRMKETVVSLETSKAQVEAQVEALSEAVLHKNKIIKGYFNRICDCNLQIYELGTKLR